jgi:tripartite-type tricarboxylate transporter receptor subunit TctC
MSSHACRRLIRTLAIGAASLAALAPQAVAQGVNFAGKTITIVVPYDAGGTTDFEARAVARYLPDELPGKPSVVVRNMPGGGGLIGVNYAGEVAKHDGLTLIMWTWNPIAWLVRDPGLRVQMGKFRSVGGLEFGEVAFMRTDPAKGVKKANDILKAELWFGGLGASNFKDIMGRLQLDILRANYHYLSGYKGSNDLVLAFGKGEINFTTISQASYISQIKPNFVDKGLATPAYQAGVPTSHGTVRHRDFPDLPTYDETFKAVHGGKAPSGDKWELYSFLLPMRAGMADVVWLAPGTPDGIVNVYRKAFDAVVEGKAFIGDYNKFVHSDPVWIHGAEGQKILDSLDGANPALVKRLNAYVDLVRNK